MKINKFKPRHWLYLTLFGVNTLIAVALRPLTKFRRKKSPIRQVILYGHRLSGNLLALHRYISKHHIDEFQLTFLTMDPEYHKRLCDQGVHASLGTHPSAITLMSTADAVISDHGLHSMLPLLWLSDVKFFDVWHGIPFKGFDENDFKTQHRYTEIWVASPLMAELYGEKFGFPREKICITGYARTDSLIIPQETDEQIRERFGLQLTSGKKLVLFAPTWKQDSNDRTLFPFGINPEIFLRDISRLCQQHDAVPVLRTHLNAKLSENLTDEAIEFLPFDQFPDTEALLQITDVLICDWSSIAFDFLLLDRPTIFLDVPPPFAKGFSLGKKHRFDRVVGSYGELLKTLGKSLENDPGRRQQNSEKRRLMADSIYSQYADGQSARRCAARLTQHLISNGSFQ